MRVATHASSIIINMGFICKLWQMLKRSSKNLAYSPCFNAVIAYSKYDLIQIKVLHTQNMILTGLYWSTAVHVNVLLEIKSNSISFICTAAYHNSYLTKLYIVEPIVTVTYWDILVTYILAYWDSTRRSNSNCNRCYYR